MKKAGGLTFILLLFSPALFAQSPCTPPSSAEMDTHYYEYLTSLMKNNKTKMAVFPFKDGNRTSVDSTMEAAFAVGLADWLKQSSGIGVYHPFVVMKTAQDAGLASSDDWAEADGIPAALAMGATHAVFGMFQKQGDDRLRYFIKIADIRQKKTVEGVLEFSTELGDRFHATLAEAAQAVLQKIGAKKIDAGQVKNILARSPSFEAFRYYVKGMESSRSYNETGLNIAKVWFDKAASLSYTFDAAYREKARVVLMMALIRRLTGKDTSLDIGEAAQILKIAGNKNVAKKKGERMMEAGPKRWMEAEFAYASGVSLLQNNQPKGAVAPLEKAVRLVPEDGLARYYLAEARAGRGGANLGPCHP